MLNRLNVSESDRLRAMDERDEPVNSLRMSAEASLLRESGSGEQRDAPLNSLRMSDHPLLSDRG